MDVSVKVAIEHITSYTYDHPVQVYPHEIRLKPAPHCSIKINSYALKIGAQEYFLNWQQDPFNNYLARVVFPEPLSQLTITVSIIAELEPINPFDFFLESWAEEWGFHYPPELVVDLANYLSPVDESDNLPRSGIGPLLRDWIQEFVSTVIDSQPSQRTISILAQLVKAVRDSVNYTVRLEVGVQSPDETLSKGSGSCRDSAWMLVAILRELGLAARFVSGYLVQLAPDVVELDGPSGPTTDFTDLHAWTEVYLPGAGWVGMDPTSGLFTGQEHIPLAATPHYNSAAPISGSTDPVETQFEFSNTVSRLIEDPRVTSPFAEDEWNNIYATGMQLDDRMLQQDIQLTMGGEPTFVSIDNRDAPEWTIAADGAQKRYLASQLTDRLRQSFHLQAVVLRNQGKWYPGEPLPRWQISLLWLTDRSPLWSNSALLADPWSTIGQVQEHMTLPLTTSPTQSTAAIEKEFALTLSHELGVSSAAVIPAYEDGLVKLMDKMSQPAGEIPAEPNSATAKHRQKILDQTDQPTDIPVAFVLPLSRTKADNGWVSHRWGFRRGRLVLIPGDSPAGLRLPLATLSWNAPEPEIPADPSIPEESRSRFDNSGTFGELAIVSDYVPTTAIVVQHRLNNLYIFLPPISQLAAWLDLIRAIERTAAILKIPVILEGYNPPVEPALSAIHITPDPGVIEINIHPSTSFKEQAVILDTLYEAAYHTRLSTQTFALDGTEHGTGGGNHITIGGATPLNSPLIRRPQLLASLVRYFQKHPALSYLFSGRFVGTTSQAPRFDEGRPEAIYEMEIALAEIDRLATRRTPPDPWLCDRALRHLLTDITGNTHRSELCIDKLYPGDISSRRLGILELRGFEMPPHFRMAMVQNLLIRTLVSWFWDHPYTESLTDFGQDLHGKNLLPYFIIHDIRGICAELNRAGYTFDPLWLEPFFHFRFPRIGTCVIDDVILEFRGAIEPWNVLGEEATGQGTSRYVDSSVERVQVLVEGFDPTRYILTCNSYPIPLLSTEKPGQYVAGIRYRAWQPPSALHPSLTVDTPLTFDLVSISAQASVGGSQYHSTHQGGLAYEETPVNESEAASRRRDRFNSATHTPGPWNISRLRSAQAFNALDRSPQGILDLRRIRTLWPDPRIN